MSPRGNRWFHRFRGSTEAAQRSSRTARRPRALSEEPIGNVRRRADFGESDAKLLAGSPRTIGARLIPAGPRGTDDHQQEHPENPAGTQPHARKHNPFNPFLATRLWGCGGAREALGVEAFISGKTRASPAAPSKAASPCGGRLGVTCARCSLAPAPRSPASAWTPRSQARVLLALDMRFSELSASRARCRKSTPKTCRRRFESLERCSGSRRG